MTTRRRPLKRPFVQVYSSVPIDVKERILEEADRRGLKISDVIREFLMEKYGNQPQKSNRGSSV